MMSDGEPRSTSRTPLHVVVRLDRVEQVVDERERRILLGFGELVLEEPERLGLRKIRLLKQTQHTRLVALKLGQLH